MDAKRVLLRLEDGWSQAGLAFGKVPVSGEVVFTTAMTGYPEVLTDPSYAGQLVVMTFPLIGIYGLTMKDLQAKVPQAAGLIVHERFESFEGAPDLLAAMVEAGRPLLSGIDTRALTLHLRQQGTCLGVIGPEDAPLVPMAHAEQLVHSAATAKPYFTGDPEGPTVALLDLGVKQGIVRQLEAQGFHVFVAPFDLPVADILAQKPELLVLSNGPGDPAELSGLLPKVRELSAALPTFGICLGHQLLALAYGGRTYKLPFGHRGANHPVRELESGRVRITAQNHGYAVDPLSLSGTDLEVTHQNANDQTVEGLRHRHLPIRCLQYHPEAGPGPWDEHRAFSQLLAKERGMN